MPAYRVIAGLDAAVAMSLPSTAVATTWTGPVGVPGPTGLTVPHVGMDAAGEAVVMWSDGAGHVYASIRSAGGRFSAPQTLAAGRDGYAVRAEQLAVGRDGTAVVVWAQVARRSPHYRVMAVVRRPHRKFGGARMVGSAQSVFRWTPSAAVDSHGRVVVAWSRDDGPRIAVAAPGRAFGAAHALRWRGAQLVVAFGADGRLYAAFSRRYSAGPAGPSLYAASTAAPPRFAAPRRVAVNGLDPALAAGPGSGVTLAWRAGLPDGEGNGIGAGTVYAAGPSRGAPFGAPVVVPPAGIVGRAPVVAGSARGALVTWDVFGGSRPYGTPSAQPVYTWLAGQTTGPWLPAQPLAVPGDWTTVPGMARLVAFTSVG